jgi:hypothetical protein
MVTRWLPYCNSPALNDLTSHSVPGGEETAPKGREHRSIRSCGDSSQYPYKCQDKKVNECEVEVRIDESVDNTYMKVGGRGVKGIVASHAAGGAHELRISLKETHSSRRWVTQWCQSGRALRG